MAALVTPYPADPERRARLLAAKLRGLLKRHWPKVADLRPLAAAGGMVVEHEGRAWALVDDSDASRGFARALLWGLHRGVAELHVLTDRSPALAGPARQAACFRTPVTLWEVSGTDVVRSDPTPLPPEPPLDPVAEPFIAVIREAGAEPVVEWGELSAEVLGLQVGRVFTDADHAWLEVGAGKHDRLAHQLASGDEASIDTLTRVVEIALEARRSGDFSHPLSQIGRERWLRHHVVRHPEVIDARQFAPIGPSVPLGDLRIPLMAPALGADANGAPLAAACSVGFDPTFVPMAAEVHAARAGADTKLALVLPESDVHELTRRAATDLLADATFRTVSDEWYRDAVADS